jgi:hypothetical protein
MIRLLITLECALLAIIALDRMFITPSVPVAVERSAPASPAETALVGMAHAQPVAAPSVPAAEFGPAAVVAPGAGVAAKPEAVAATSVRSRVEVLTPSRDRDTNDRVVVLPPRRPIVYRPPAERLPLPAPRPDHTTPRREGPKLVVAQRMLDVPRRRDSGSRFAGAGYVSPEVSASLSQRKGCCG